MIGRKTVIKNVKKIPQFGEMVISVWSGFPEPLDFKSMCWHSFLIIYSYYRCFISLHLKIYG